MYLLVGLRYARPDRHLVPVLDVVRGLPHTWMEIYSRPVKFLCEDLRGSLGGRERRLLVPASRSYDSAVDDIVTGPIRIVLVDDHQIVLDGLRSMLAPYSESVAIVASTTDPVEARHLVLDLNPDVAVVDVRMQSIGGLELCEELHRLAPNTKVVLLTVYDNEQYLFEGLRAGASGYLTKQLGAEELLIQLRRVVAGEVVIDPGLAGRVALSAARLQRGEFWSGAALGLSQRESEVLELMVRGLSNRAIATRLLLGEETIKTHTRAIFRKLQVSDRTQAVARALREGTFQ